MVKLKCFNEVFDGTIESLNNADMCNGQTCPSYECAACQAFSELVMNPDPPPEPRQCKYCQKTYDKSEMLWTHDCQGINYRHVCYGCYEVLMAKGYDGQYYDERDECLEYNW